MRSSRLFPIAWSVVILVTALRALFAASLPLTGDEAYYWEWSRRLAGGYVDHPPAVAFAIAAFDWIGRTPFAVRFAAVLCGIGTALASAGAANVLSGDRRAGAVAALSVTLAPIMIVAFGMASPDAPYALAWSCALYCAVRVFRDGTSRWTVTLGIALGVALLSRLFAVALVGGIAAASFGPAQRHLWRRGLWLSMLIAAVLWAPFLIWNATHGWISFTFALVGRHEMQLQPVRPLIAYALDAIAFSPGLWIAATIVGLRPKHTLVAWTALPLSVVFFILAFRERVEVYWFIGPFVSLSIGFACAFARWSTMARRHAFGWAFAPAIVLSALIFIAALAPGAVYAALRGSGLHLSDGGPFELFTYPRLARDVRALTQGRQAVAMTDGYGFSSLLDFYGDLRPFVIGYDAQGEEARRWFTDADRPSRALFVDKVPLATRPDFVRQLFRACARVEPGPVLSYAFAPGDARVPPRRYYTTWCQGMGPSAVSILRWQSPG